MRKASRGEGAKKRAGSGDRSSKPGFRPKGNNAGTRAPRKRTTESDDSESPRPRRSAGGFDRSSDTKRTSRPSTSRGARSFDSDRPERSSRFNREERSERPARFERSSGADRPERSSRFSRDERDERPSRSSSRTERPERSSRFSRDDRDERPSRSSSRTERPERSSRFSREDRDERPARSSSRSERPSRDERPERSASRSERPAGRSTYNPADRGRKDDRPSSTDRRRSFDSDRPFKRSEGGDERRGRKPSSSRFEKEKSTFRRPRTGEKSVLSDDGSTRLNKYIANCGICSRREADELIKVGLVSVNGTIITEMGYKVQPGDEVRYNNELLRGERPVYLLLNKPKDYITTVEDPGNRHTVMELIANACKERVYPVGRLDRNTTGVLLFTNDGDLARKLMHPSFQVQKVYHVTLDKTLKPDDMEQILEGVKLEDGPIKADDIAYAGDGADRKEIGIELHSGRNRIVRRIFEHFGHEVMKLDRTVFAGLTKKDLPRGRWRFLTPMEVANLKMQVGDRRYREAMREEQ